MRLRGKGHAVEITPTRLSVRDAVEEALAAMLARPARASLTVLGTVLGVAAFVAVLGLTATASGQVSKRFTVLAATEVTIDDAPADPSAADFPYPVGTEQRLMALNGVKNAGIYWQPKISATGSRGFVAGPDDAGLGRTGGRRKAVTLPVSAALSLERAGISGGVPAPPIST